MTTPDETRRAKGWHKVSMWLSAEDEAFIELLVKMRGGLASKAEIIREALHFYADANPPSTLVNGRKPKRKV
jgi:hypothetical protein